MQDEPPKPGERRGARTRRRVLEAALSVVAEVPLADVQLQHIADRVGISAGHVLYHFGSKEGILVETLKWSEGQITERRSRELRELDGPVARLERWIVLFLPHSADDPTWKLWLELWLRSTFDERLRRIPGDISDSWLDDFQQILEEGVSKGAFDLVEKERFSTWTHSMLIGLSIGVLVGWLELDEARRLALEWVGKELGCTFPTT